MKTILIGLAVLAASSSYAGNLFANSSFEWPRVPSQRFPITAGTTSLPGWHMDVVSPGMAADMHSSLYPGGVQASRGDQAIQLGGTHGYTSIWQDVPVVPFQDYLLYISWCGEGPSRENTVRVAINDVLWFHGGQNPSWYGSSYLIQGTAANHFKLELGALEAPQGIIVDDVMFFPFSDAIGVGKCKPVDFVGSCEGHNARVDYRNDTTGAVIHSTYGPLAPSGLYEADAPDSSGTYTISIDGDYWLKQTIHHVGVYLGVNELNFQPRVGDPDGSGEVDAADIDFVIANFGSLTSVAADIDGSAEVDAADIDMVIAHFGEIDGE